MKYALSGEIWLCGDGPWSIKYSDGSKSVGLYFLDVMEDLESLPMLSPDKWIISRNLQPEKLSETETILCKEGLRLSDGRFVRFSIPDSAFRELIDGEWVEPSEEVLWTEVWSNPCWDLFKERRRESRRKLNSILGE